MAKAISVHEKRRGRGRPATGVDPAVTARIPAEILARVEKWATANGWSRSEGIVRLLERGLVAARTDAQVESRAGVLKRALSSEPVPAKAQPRRTAKKDKP
jgi:hypothetical protein